MMLGIAGSDSGRSFLPMRVGGFSRVALAVLILGAAQLLGGIPRVDAQDLTSEQMEEDLQQLTDVIHRTWAYGEYKKEEFGIDVDAIHARLGQRVNSISTKTEFAFLLREYSSALQDGHAGVYIPGVGTLGNRAWPFEVIEVEEGIAVHMVHPDVEKNSPIRNGDLIVEVEGQGVQEYLKERAGLTWASTDRHRRYIALNRTIRVARAHEVQFIIQKPNGEKTRCDVKTRKWSAWEDYMRRPEEPTFKHRTIGADIGYMRLSSFRPRHWAWDTVRDLRKTGKKIRRVEEILQETKDSIRKAFRGFRDTKALILDLRGNTGGTDLLGTFLAQYFVDEPTFV